MKILLIDDDLNLNRVLAYQLQKNGHEVVAANSGTAGLKYFYQQEFDIVITDIQMPDITGIDVLKSIRKTNNNIIVIIITAHGSVENAIEACKIGANDYITKPFGQEQLLFTLNKAVQLKKLENENTQLKSQIFEKKKFKNIVSKSKKMEDILQATHRIAQSDATVLILGESGTGKQLIANAIHYNSDRKNKPFITVNCPSIPQNLLESELFGHLKGSFTGAVKDRLGKFELADSGTLFLDEIGDLSEELQAKLLRVLQEKTIEKLGDQKVKHVDVRVITATNRNLEEMISKGKFREDLYYRIAVVPITIPPLRERKEDIPILVKHFIKKYAAKRSINIDQNVMDILQSYHWPGNVRELENAIEHILIFIKNDQIKKEDIPGNIQNIQQSHPDSEVHLLDDLQKTAIQDALKKSNGNKSRAAELLGIQRHVLLYKLKKYNLN